MTLVELRNIWNYKHCFEVKTYEHQQRNVFQHKHFSLCAQVKNLTLFLAGRNVIGKGRKGVKIVNEGR